MNILLINYEYPPLGGGGGVASANLAEEWKRQGNNITILTTHFKGLKKIEHSPNLNIYRIPVWGRRSKEKAGLISMLTFPCSSLWQGIKLCRKTKFDIINTHFAVPTGPTGYILSRLFKIKNILSIHGADVYDPTRPFYKNPLLRLIIKFILNQADILVAQSQNIKEQTIKIYNLKKDIKIIPLGLVKPNISPLSPIKNRGGSFQLISIGRLVQRKGFEYLIKALKDLDKNIKLNIIGCGPEKKNLTLMIKNLKLKNRVKILDNINNQKKWQYLCQSDCYVMPSIHEGFAIVGLEAMHCGLPIIATNFGGQTDYLKENQNAILVKPKDPQSLAWAIKEIYINMELREKMKKNNLQKINNYYIEAIAEKYLKLFNLCLNLK